MYSLAQLLKQSVASYPNEISLCYRQRCYSFSDLADSVARLVELLAKNGAEAGDRAGIYLGKSPCSVVSMLACSELGLIFVPINPMLKPHQVAHILTDCSVTTLLTQNERVAALELVLQESCVGRLVTAGELDNPMGFDVAKTHGKTRPDELPERFADAEMMLYTSGSTGKPKGVVISGENLRLGALSVADYTGLTHEDRILALLPFSFDYGFNQLTTALLTGARLVLQDFLLPNDVVKAVAEHQITGIAGVPPLWCKVAAAQWPEEVGEHLRLFTNSGGKLHRPVLEKLCRIFPNADPYLMYGLTEAFRSTYLPPSEVDNRPGSIGKAMPNAEVFVLNEAGDETQAGETGELVHCGPTVTMGYWNAQQTDQERFRNTPSIATLQSANGKAVWTGDKAYRDEDGFLYFVGRADDMIKSSGFRISPDEIEEVAYTLKGVKEAVALGVEHPELGQEIILVAEVEDPESLTESVLRSHFTKNVPQYMVPTRIFIGDELPRGQNSKFDRMKIRQRIEAEIEAAIEKQGNAD